MCIPSSRSPPVTPHLLFLTQGYFDEASSLGKQSWAILEKALGPEHPDVAMALTNRARLLMNEVKTNVGFYYGKVCSILVRTFGSQW